MVRHLRICTTITATADTLVFTRPLLVITRAFETLAAVNLVGYVEPQLTELFLALAQVIDILVCLLVFVCVVASLVFGFGFARDAANAFAAISIVLAYLVQVITGQLPRGDLVQPLEQIVLVHRLLVFSRLVGLLEMILRRLN